MPGQRCHRPASLVLLLVTGCNSAVWLPSLTVGLQGVLGDRSGQQQPAREKAALRLGANARLGWRLEAASPPRGEGAADPARAPADPGPRVSREATDSPHCLCPVLCAWEEQERARALGASIPGLKP
jgi:hypothetical protein